MANLLVEIGNTALKACWSDGMTLGKTFRFQGEKAMDFILSLTAKEKPYVMVVCSVYGISPQEEAVLSKESTFLEILDGSKKETLREHGLPEYLSYDRAASILAARYLFRGKGCTVFDFGTTMTVDFTDEKGNYLGGNISLGCRTRFKALNRYSKSLPLVNTPEDVQGLGNSLQTSMESGVVSGIMFEITGYSSVRPDNIVVFTGGDANYFAKQMKNSIFVVCNLVLMGLALLAEEYEKKVGEDS